MSESDRHFESIQDYFDEERARELARKMFENLSDAPAKPNQHMTYDESEPEHAGVRVGQEHSAAPDAGKIRAAHAIESFMRGRNGRASESALVERLTAAGFGEKKAREFLQEACDEGIIVNNGRFYTLRGEE
jgi:hypothetical protein